MRKSKFITPFIVIGLLWIVVMVVSWLAIPAWRNAPGSIWSLIAVSAPGVVSISKDLISIWKELKEPTTNVFKKQNIQHGDRITQTITSQGDVFQLGSGSILTIIDDKIEKPSEQIPKEFIPPRLPPRTSLPKPGTLPPGSPLPFPRNDVFTGREQDLTYLAIALLYDRQPAAITQPAAVSGMGGIGKTQLAVEICYRYGRYTRGVHWIQASQDINTEIAACGANMGLKPWPEKLPDQVRATLDRWQQDPERLVVLDNLDDPALLQEWLPRMGGVRLLVTSRRSDWPKTLGVHNHTLGLFTRPESLQLLRRLAPRLDKNPDDELLPIANRLGNLPLALHLAGCYMADRSTLSPAGYLQELDEAGSALAHTSLLDWVQGSPTEHENSLAATFLLSWQRLISLRRISGERKGVRALASRLFLAAGYCAPNVNIPTIILSQAAGIQEESFPDFDRALSMLCSLRLLDPTETSPRIHPLLAEFARSQDKAQSESILPTLAKSLSGLVSKANQIGFHKQAAPFRPHLLPVASAVEKIDPPLSAGLLNELGYLLRAMGDYPAARPYYEQALAINREVLGEKHPDTANSLNNLGFLLRAMGDYPAARPYYKQALAIRRKVLGEKHPDTATSLNNLGALLRAMGDYPAARPYYEQALAIQREVLGEKHPDTATSLNNLGILLHAMGDYPAARPYYEQSLAINREVLGEKHPDTANSLNNLGGLLQAMGDYPAARPYYEQSLAIRREVLGERHPDTATSLNNLGGLLQAMCDYPAARPYLEQSLAIRREVLGEKHPDTATSLNNLGGLLQAMGDYPAARPYLEQALAIKREVLGEKHPDTATSLNDLGFLLQAMGDYSAARPYYEQALAILEATLLPNHPHIQLVRDNLARLTKEQPPSN